MEKVGPRCHFVRSVLGVRKVPEFELRKFFEFERLFQLPKGNLSGKKPFSEVVGLFSFGGFASEPL